MKTKYLIGLVVLILMSCKEKPKIQGKKIPGGIYAQYEHDPLLQYVKVMGPGQRMMEEGDTYEGKRSGAWISYHNGEIVKSITNYHNGVKQGPFIGFGSKGDLEEKAWYTNNKLNGRYLKYKSRRLREEKNYTHGVLNGPVKIYYASGTVMESSIYVDGNIDGIARWYDMHGNISIESIYKDGELVEQKTGDQIKKEATTEDESN